MGYFWRKIFRDRDALRGLSLADATASEQAYYNILELINGYSADNISIFEKRNWYPLHIRRSDLDNNFLLFGEGVAFGEQVSSEYYVFGESIPSGNNVYSMLLPEELREISILTDQIISPAVVLVAGQNIQVKGRRIFFSGHPFSHSGVQITKLVNDDGSPKTYNDYGDQDEQITFWACNAKIDADYLLYNIGYLFGLNVPHNEQGKQILSSIMHQYTNGPTVHDIKAVCLSAIGVPAVREAGEILSIEPSLDETQTVITTETGVYRYPAVYQLKTSTIVGATTEVGDVLVEAVELYDNVNNPEWWNTDFKALIAGSNKLPLSLPAAAMLGSYKYNLLFPNEMGLVTADASGAIASFPVVGTEQDVATYLGEINNAAFVEALNEYAGDTLSDSNPLGINPVDFLLKHYLASCTAFLRVKFYSADDMARFGEYFEAIRETLPPYILFLIVCDLSLPHEVMQLDQVVDDAAVRQFNHMLTPVSEITMFNAGVTTGALMIQDMEAVRVIPARAWTTADIRAISLTKAS